jgi:hypothetical protein
MQADTSKWPYRTFPFAKEERTYVIVCPEGYLVTDDFKNPRVETYTKRLSEASKWTGSQVQRWGPTRLVKDQEVDRSAHLLDAAVAPEVLE